MKKFSDFKKPLKRLNEDQDMMTGLPKANLPEGSEEEKTNNSEGSEVGSEKTEVHESGSVSKFFSKLFESREMAHIYHLTVNGEPGSHAAHKALQEYYEGILEFIDEMIEVYQGQYGIIENYETIDTTETKTKEKIAYFEELVNFVKTEKKCIKPEDSHLLNIVDEAVALIYKTLYKLKYNK
jgi:hypothetical protein